MFKYAPLLFLLCVFTAPAARAEAPDVVASIRPLHGIVSAIMEGAGQPALLIEGNQSPHGFHLKPSHMEQLHNADLVFYIDGQIESFLVKPLNADKKQSRKAYPMADAPDLLKLERRSGDNWDDHNHDHDNHGHHDHHDHGKADYDPHFWLSPENARIMAAYIVDILAGTDPDNAQLYRQNAGKLSESISRTEAHIHDRLAPVKDRRFIVFHDAWQYFEHDFGLESAGSITLDPSVPPGAKTVLDVRRKIHETGASCIFSEPQFQSRIIDNIREDTNAASTLVDPLGSDIPTGPEFYPVFLSTVSQSIYDCLSQGN